MNQEKHITHSGGCHCERVRFNLQAPARLVVSQCNCSICAQSGYLGLMVEPERFELISGEEFLVEYRFNTGTANHRFCRVCGIKSFYIPRSHPHLVNINARCLDPENIEQMTVRSFDGQNWERYYSDNTINPNPE